MITAIDTLAHELRYASRSLHRAPGFSVVAILVMALGIGANIALFAVVHGVLLKPLPFKDPERLLMVYERGIGGDFQGDAFNMVSGAMYAEWKRHNRSFSDLVLVNNSESSISSNGGLLPEKVRNGKCSWNMLRTLGIEPAFGRDFTVSDDQPSAEGTVLLSWSIWKRRFGGDPAILNQPIHLNGKSYTVIGVLPAWFTFPDASIQLWTPVYHDYSPDDGALTNLANYNFHVLGRLRDGVTSAQSLTDLSLITKHVHDQHLDNPFIAMAANARPLLDDMVGNVRRPLLVLLAAAGCVLLIACLNVANLLVARSVALRKELAIRAALGCGRFRLLRERLTESFLLTAAGGVVGSALGAGAIAWFVRARHDMNRVDAIHFDGAVVVFALVLIVFCAVFSSLVSAFGANQTQVFAGLSETSRSFSSGRTRATLRRALLTIELSLTVVLLIGAGLLLRSYQRLRTADMGCSTENVLTMSLDLSGARYVEPTQIVNFYNTLLAQVQTLPGVTAVGFVRGVPGQGIVGNQAFTIAEHPPLPQSQGQVSLERWADADYFHAMGIPIRQGMTFDPSRKLDDANQAIISASFARQYLPNEDPIGKHVVTGGHKYEIVGVVGDTRYQVAKPAKPILYLPLYTGLFDYGKLVIRSNQDVEQLALPIQRIVLTIDHDLPVSDVLTMDQLLNNSTHNEGINTTLLVVFASLSLTLAVAGLFGVLSYLVAQRTNEIGIRIALGAKRKQVLSLMLWDGLRPALLGLAFGLGGSAAAARLISSMLYETQPLDPMIFAAVAALIVGVAVAACMFPAWKASQIDPMEALRVE